MLKTIEVRVPCDGELWRKEGTEHYYVVHSNGNWMACVEGLYDIVHIPMSLEDTLKSIQYIGRPRACSKSTVGVFEGIDNWKYIALDWREWLSNIIDVKVSRTKDTIKDLWTAIGDLWDE